LFTEMPNLKVFIREGRLSLSGVRPVIRGSSASLALDPAGDISRKPLFLFSQSHFVTVKHSGGSG